MLNAAAKILKRFSKLVEHPRTKVEGSLIERADAARDRGDFAAAASFYQQIIDIDPDNASILVQAGNMNKELRNLELAQVNYLRAKALLPENADLFLQMGHLYKVWNRLGDAIEAYQNAADLAPGWQEPVQEIEKSRQMVEHAIQRIQAARLAIQQDRFRDSLNGPCFAQTMADARAQDPAVGAIAEIHELLVPPRHDPLYLLHATIRSRLQANHYDTVICVPWIRNGGADLVAGCVSHTMVRICPGERTLLLRVDNPHFERSDWISDDVECVDISDMMALVGQSDAERLLYVVLVGVGAKRVININSRYCWEVFARFGARLARRASLYSYLFCWDLTPHGSRAGYPAEFYPESAKVLSGVFVDTRYLKSELERIFRLPKSMADQLIMLPSPMMGTPATPSMAEQHNQISLREQRARPLVLWGARLDRQKRLDLLVEIARAMPRVDFQCWGVALLDQPPDLSRKPNNLHMMGAFRWISELPLAEASGWLYTSSWEGMPTALIELARLGVPVVASDAGGISELITAETGWLLPPDATCADYVSAIAEMISSPALRVAKTTRLQHKVAHDYAADQYDRIIKTAISNEAVS